MRIQRDDHRLQIQHALRIIEMHKRDTGKVVWVMHWPLLHRPRLHMPWRAVSAARLDMRMMATRPGGSPCFLQVWIRPSFNYHLMIIHTALIVLIIMTIMVLIIDIYVLRTSSISVDLIVKVNSNSLRPRPTIDI